MSDVGHRDEMDPSSAAPDSDTFENDTDDLLGDDLEDYDDSSWDDEGEEDPEGEERKPRKKGLLSFNTIVIAIAVVFGGGFVLMQLSKQAPSSSTQSVAPVSRIQMTGMTDNPVFKDVREEAPKSILPLPGKEMPPAPLSRTADLGSLKDDRPLSAPPEASEAKPSSLSSDVLTPLPSVALSEKAVDSADSLAAFRKKPVSPVPSENGESQTKTPSPLDLSKSGAGALVPAVPVGDVEKAALPDSPSKEGAISAVVQAPGPAGIESDARTQALHQEVSRLSDRLSGIEKRISEISRVPPTSVVGSVQKDPEIAKLRDSLAQLQRELDSLRSEKPENKPVKAVEKIKASPIPGNLSVSSREKAVKSVPPKTKENTQPSRKVKTPDVPAAPPSAPRWEIRAIQPGVAWVAPVGGNDMQTVSVGDSLPGLGVVRRISVVDGVWVVEGTTGRLRQ
ncbi:MAG: hypothetical protein H6862_04245 [Rhodospirillales bacterium]|nr:hypothetical protein [Rhodospirillales bacterium]